MSPSITIHDLGGFQNIESTNTPLQNSDEPNYLYAFSFTYISTYHQDAHTHSCMLIVYAYINPYLYYHSWNSCLFDTYRLNIEKFQKKSLSSPKIINNSISLIIFSPLICL